MSELSPTLPRSRSWMRALPFYYGWVQVILAATAMTATLPGRTHGLGLITEPLLLDLQLDHVWFARINLIGSLAGAAFCFPIGWLIDRYGVRVALVGVTLPLGLAVVGMSRCESGTALLVWLILVRGFGQSALSIVSMAMIGKWFSRRLGPAMGLFAVLLTFGFIGGVLSMGWAVEALGWRAAWKYLGFVVLALTPCFWLLARRSPAACGLQPDAPSTSDPTSPLEASSAALGYSLRQALATPAFWVIALGTSAFNLVWSGVTLFNESMLAERSLPPGAAVEIMAILTGIGLLANLASGAFATRRHVVRLLGVGLALLAASLAAFPSFSGIAGARLYAIAIGASGGIITVVFFAAWKHLFGQAALGRIQGAAQFATVLASAAGPLIIAEARDRTGSYAPSFYALAIVIALLASAAFLVRLPPPEPSPR